MAVLWAALMPHPPVLIPAVGKGREKEAGLTLAGAARLLSLATEANKRLAPKALVLLSPHLPYRPGSLFINTAANFNGSLARFGAPSARIEALCAADMIRALLPLLKEADIPVSCGEMADITPDHGAIVPLLVLADSFPDGAPPLLMANPAGLAPDQALRLGQALGGLSTVATPWAFIASGDLSHRLKEDGPYGFNPDGPVFDAAVVEALGLGSPGPLLSLTPEQRENAGECGLRSVLALLGLTRAPVEVLSYEGPFGVGYCLAFWKAGQDADNAQKPGVRVSVSGRARVTGTTQNRAGDCVHPYPRLARRTVSALLSGKPLPDSETAADISEDAALWTQRHGCFVSIKTTAGDLRGCIGTFLPTQPRLDAEIIANAVSASTQDPRFPPMREAELDGVLFSVDVLSEPEIVSEGMELDCRRYGVIVSKGGRRGLLLPDLPGVDSVERQLEIAARKGGIGDLAGAEIRRFTVDRYEERARGKG